MSNTDNLFHKNLASGQLYWYRNTAPSLRYNTLQSAIFRGYVKNKSNVHQCVFEDMRGRVFILPSKNLVMNLSQIPMLAKQYARGLCNRMPEDCAGLVERFLVGDKVVGPGPDRYPER